MHTTVWSATLRTAVTYLCTRVASILRYMFITSVQLRQPGSLRITMGTTSYGIHIKHTTTAHAGCIAAIMRLYRLRAAMASCFNPSGMFTQGRDIR